MFTKSQIAKWTADLRANPDLQGQGSLETNGKFCCLGRMCYIFQEEFELRRTTSAATKHNVAWYNGATTYLPGVLSTTFGSSGGNFYEWPGAVEMVAKMAQKNGKVIPMEHELASLNDSNWTFAEIADIVDACYPAIDDPT